MSKRFNCGELVTTHKKCNAMHMKTIAIDHSLCEDFKTYKKVLNGKTFGDQFSDIKFVIDNEEIDSHSEILQILSNQRQLVKDLIERDKRLAKQQNCSEANIFQMSGTTVEAFRALLQYIYTGKVNCDLKTAMDLGLTAIKLKFNPLVVSIAEMLTNNISDCLRSETVDDLYHISKVSNNRHLRDECTQYMDTNAEHLKALFMKRNIEENDASNVLTYCWDKSRYNNYIHFFLPESTDICFNVLISNDRINWFTVQRNEDIWCKSWNWVYFREHRFKYFRIVCTDQLKDDNFDILTDIKEENVLCKRANVELNFDPKTKYLIPKHDVIQYPIPMTKQFFDLKQKKGYTYCTSRAPDKDKERYYIYHRVGDGKPVEFYLCQTCLIDSIRFRLWDKDDRTYDFKVEVRKEDDNKKDEQNIREEGSVDNWITIKDGKEDIFKKRKSWQTISLGSLQPVRWIRITGLKAPQQDPEFAIIHFECPPQTQTN